MAKMMGVWLNIMNPERTSDDDLNITVGGVIVLKPADPKGLWNVQVRVMDDDTFSDDEVFKNNDFSRNINDTSPTPFMTGIIVPASKLKSSEPSYEDWAEIYCRVSAKLGNKSTNWSNSQNEDVRI